MADEYPKMLYKPAEEVGEVLFGTVPVDTLTVEDADEEAEAVADGFTADPFTLTTNFQYQDGAKGTPVDGDMNKGLAAQRGVAARFEQLPPDPDKPKPGEPRPLADLEAEAEAAQEAEDAAAEAKAEAAGKVLAEAAKALAAPPKAEAKKGPGRPPKQETAAKAE